MRYAYAIEDIDKDGYTDVIYKTVAGKLYLVRQKSTGGFHPGVQIGYGWQAFRNFTYCGGNGTSTCMYAITEQGRLSRYNLSYTGSNRAFVAIPRSTVKVGYVAPRGYLQPTARITPLGNQTNTLTSGFNGVKVRIVQQRLGIWSTSRLASMDSGTMSSVRAFQRRAGLPVTGSVDQRTWNAMRTGYSWTVDQYQASPIAITATKQQRINAMINYAMAQRGSSYTWGGAGTYNLGFDCSGLVLQALYAAGMDPQPINVLKHSYPTYRSSQELYKYSGFKHVPISQRQRGDLIFYKNSRGTIVHVSIYLGNDQVIHTDWMGRPARVDHITTTYGWSGTVGDVVRPFA